jgi:hypothetical protein
MSVQVVSEQQNACSSGEMNSEMSVQAVKNSE